MEYTDLPEGVEATWHLKDGKPIPNDSPDYPEKIMTPKFPLSLWRIEDGKPITGFIPKTIAEPIMTKPYPYSLWRIDKYVNDGMPYTELMPGLSRITPPVKYDILRLGYQVRCISPPHGMDRWFPITKISIPLNDVTNTTYSLGKTTKVDFTYYTKRRFTDVNNGLNRKKDAYTLTDF